MRTNALRVLRALGCGSLIAAFVLLVIGVGGGVHVSAHAAVVRADPEPDSAVRIPPARITIWFSEPIAPALSSIQVLDASGARFDTGASSGDPTDNTKLSVGVKPLANGTYTVAWNNVSTLDGHPLIGAYVFYVGDKPEAAGAVPPPQPAAPALPSPEDPWVRWVVFLAALAASGSLMFELAVLRPATRTAPDRAPMRAAISAVGRLLARGRLIAVGAFLVASLVQLAVQSSVVASRPLWATGPGDVVKVLTLTGWGTNWLLRVAFIVVALAILVVAERLRRRRAQDFVTASTVPSLLALVAMFGALGSYSLSSHGAASTLAFPGAATDYVHFVAAALWVGGLFSLLPTLIVLARTVPAADRRPLVTALAERFTTVASLGLGVLVLTGLYSSWLEVTTPAALGTPYGIALVVKVALVAVLALLGAANLLWIRPMLAQAERAEAATRWLQRLVMGEVVVAVLVLLSVGFLTSFEPARQAYERTSGGGIRFSQTDNGTKVDGVVQPAVTGTNRVQLTLRDRRGNQITNAGAVEVRIKYVDVELGTTEVNATLRPDGRYEVPAFAASIAGTWEVQVTVTRPDAGDATIAARFPLSASAAAVAGAPAELGRTLWSWLVLLVGMLVLVVAPRAWASRIARTRVRVVATTVVMVGVVLVYGAHTHSGNPQPTSNANPIAANAESIAAGKDLYATNCVPCHGSTGLGDGPSAAGLNPPPADLRSHVPLHGDGQLFQFISGGFPGSAMPAFNGKMSDTQMWNLVNYLRSLSQTPLPTQ